MNSDRFLIDGRLWVVTRPIGVAGYDFDFRGFFDCFTPWDAAEGLPAIARIGAFDDYKAFHAECRDLGIELVHTPEDYKRCTHLPEWLPLITNDTPRSRWYAGIPSFEEIEADFDLPVFIKGARQTSRHQAAASIIRSRDDYEAATAIYRADPVLRWQEFVCREFMPLRSVGGGIEGKVPASFEFRTFWWRCQLVGDGAYWVEANRYDWTPSEREEALAVGRRVVQALNCDFLVVDLAQTAEGRWVCIEVNDGMESGYGRISPFGLWRNVMELELA